jgi:hypothetical protein
MAGISRSATYIPGLFLMALLQNVEVVKVNNSVIAVLTLFGFA